MRNVFELFLLHPVPIMSRVIVYFSWILVLEFEHYIQDLSLP